MTKDYQSLYRDQVTIWLAEVVARQKAELQTERYRRKYLDYRTKYYDCNRTYRQPHSRSYRTEQWKKNTWRLSDRRSGRPYGQSGTVERGRSIFDKVQPVNTAVRPVNNAVRPVNNAVRPVNNAVRPVNNAVRPVNNAVRPVNNAVRPVDTTVRPAKRQRGCRGSRGKKKSTDLPTLPTLPSPPHLPPGLPSSTDQSVDLASRLDLSADLFADRLTLLTPSDLPGPLDLLGHLPNCCTDLFTHLYADDLDDPGPVEIDWDSL
ncbi:hypothetical protein GGS24DRAFT_123959 [Hypoxylon argillaceum]|nr:hypothetical protein GGS24DRAFT_123959 [Hypoxylon argillaceum]